MKACRCNEELSNCNVNFSALSFQLSKTEPKEANITVKREFTLCQLLENNLVLIRVFETNDNP